MAVASDKINAVCPVCDSRDADFAFVKSGYSHYRCRSCGSFYVWPKITPDELAQLYTTKQQKECISQTPSYLSTGSHEHLLGTWKYLMRRIENLIERGPLLDLGCGAGQFLAFADKVGWNDLAGVELVPKIAERAQKSTNAKIYIGEVSKISLPSRYYSAITSFDVIEHLSDIQGFLKKAYYLLKPGGIIAIGTFNAKGMTMRLLKENSMTVAPPEHVTLLTKLGMDKALKQAGFDVKKTLFFSIYLREYVRFIYKDKNMEMNSQINQNNFTSSKIFLSLMKIADFFLNLTNLGDEFYTIAQKPFDA